jgi:hypothetical protein
MERIRFIEHQGQRLLLVDCADCPAKEIAELADILAKFLDPEPDNSVLLLADFTDAQFTREAIERIKIAAVFNRKHLKRSAWVFNGNLSKTLHDAIQSFSSRRIPQFETREEATKFLVSGS